jgi:hypothetical protein
MNTFLRCQPDLWDENNFAERSPGKCAQKLDVDRSALVRAEPFTDTASPLLAGAYRCMSRSRVQILTKQSSPADANMPGFVGFQDIALTQPEI